MMNFCKSASARMLALSWLMGIVLFFPFDRVGAQNLRDPSLPPGEAGLASAAPGEKSPGVEPGAMTIIVRNGLPHLVVGTRLYAQGQKLGQARIERISETEVWLREGGVLRKVPQFPGIQRRTVTAACAANETGEARAAKTSKVSKASSFTKTPLTVAPCAGVQP